MSSQPSPVFFMRKRENLATSWQGRVGCEGPWTVGERCDCQNMYSVIHHWLWLSSKSDARTEDYCIYNVNMNYWAVCRLCRLNNVCLLQVNTGWLGASYQVYLSRDPLIVSGKIWAEQSCHIPDHCKSPTNISQHHQSHHWPALGCTGLHCRSLFVSSCLARLTGLERLNDS